MRTLQRFGVMMMLLLIPGLGLAAKGGPNSGATGMALEERDKSGSGAVLGDLIHIKRDAVSGQPILQKRWIEYPQDIRALLGLAPKTARRIKRMVRKRIFRWTRFRPGTGCGSDPVKKFPPMGLCLKGGYCPIAVDENGNEIGFMALSCDPIDPAAVVEVDYRLPLCFGPGNPHVHYGGHR